MIAVVDTCQDGLRFVRHLFHLGFEVSWLVRTDANICLEVMSPGFRGCIHHVGYDDPAQIRTALSGCGQILVLAEEMGPNFEGTELQAVFQDLVSENVDLLRVTDRGGKFEVEEFDPGLKPGRKAAAPAAIEIPNLLSHVG